MKKLLPLPVLIFACTLLSAQSETNFWFFGLNAGMNFASGSPVVFQGTINTTEGTTSSSDSMGNLNFYSEGVNVWDQTGAIMPNGTGLNGSVSTTVSALAVPHPGNPDLHYLFTLDEAQDTSGFCYSVIDMTLNSGNGDVTQKNTFIQGDVTEKMAAVQQLGTNNYWVTVHEWGTDAFYSYLITSAGLQTTPVISNAGMIHTIDPQEQNKMGQMKFNTCGTKLALAIGYLDTVDVLDFDPATGIFSNPITLPLGDNVYGVEFSQDASMLYITRYNTGLGFADLVQFDLTSGVQSTIQASMTVISSNTSGTNFYYGLQLAKDEKIYVNTSWSSLLGVIDNPEIAGAGCNFNPSGFDLDPFFLGVSSGLGLPAFVQSYFRGEVACSPTGLNEQSEPSWSISPALSSEGFLLHATNHCHITVFDYSGKIVEQHTNISANSFYFGMQLTKGAYLVKMDDGKNVKYSRITKF